MSQHAMQWLLLIAVLNGKPGCATLTVTTATPLQEELGWYVMSLLMRT
jgi:hypothetical protein